ncbi:MAG TPA: cyclodeaminase/cyclohydrolase family protein [Candidatus Limnocylindria bacterium]|nr:cyclodeaminase/cyclohydrolase family protein [Candidatus Limnocylindria bacterium]
MGDSTELTDLPVHAFLERLGSSDPVPGGGSAAALAAAMGAALVAMVAELTIGRPAYADHDETIRKLRFDALERRTELLELAQQDSDAYDIVVSARHLPKDSEAERAARSSALEAAMLDAARIPLRAAVVASEVLDLAERIAPIGNRNAVSDAGVAAHLAAAGLRGALLNVRINLPYLAENEPMKESAPVEIARLEALAAKGERAALAAVDARLVGT